MKTVKNCCYMKVTNDKYRLPVAVADSAVELPAYIEQLKNLPEKQKRIFLYGSWDVDV